MKGILADNNVVGHVVIQIGILENPFWNEIWASLAIPLCGFDDVGLAPNAADSVLWRACQQKEIVLVTANRNKDKPDSLEAILRAENTPTSLPVITLADPKRIYRESSYANRVAEKLLERLLFIDEIRGAGRVFVP